MMIHIPQGEIEVQSPKEHEWVKTLSSPSSRCELILTEFIKGVMEREYAGKYWVETEVNLWKLLPERRRKTGPELMKDLKHLLQPDIDLLYGPIASGRKKTPMHAVEIKYFGEIKARAIPKTRQGEGFYAGLNQALALLLYGVDTVELWHFFHLPYQEWVKFEEYEDFWPRKLEDDFGEFSGAYSAFVKVLIDMFGLPLGYRNIGVITEGSELSLIPLEKLDILPKPNPFRGRKTSERMREVILQGLRIEDLR